LSGWIIEWLSSGWMDRRQTRKEGKIRRERKRKYDDRMHKRK
jgi:hypothetical protein